MRKLSAILVIAANFLLVLMLLGIRDEDRVYHRQDVEDAYQGLVSRGLLDAAKSEEYARNHNGWHPRKRLEMIGAPSGFSELLFRLACGACIVNVVTILFLARNKHAGAGQRPR